MNTSRRNRIETPHDTKAPGRPCCYCGKERPKSRRRWCSDECVDDFLVRKGDANAIERILRGRDHEICQLCHADTKLVWRVLRKAIEALYDADEMALWSGKTHVFGLFGIPEFRERLWDADHIVPVIEGGGGCGIDNYRTLCIWCHRDETAKLAQRRAIAKRDGDRQLLAQGELNGSAASIV